MDNQAYDLVVIGGGPAGAAAAWRATLFGKHVALVEKKENLGGAGINTWRDPKQNPARNRPRLNRLAVPRAVWCRSFVAPGSNRSTASSATNELDERTRPMV